MINILDELGKVIGFKGSSTQPSPPTNPGNVSSGNITQESNIPTYGREARADTPTTSPWDTKAEKLKSVQYPLGGDGKHCIKFYINISEESKLIKKQQVEVNQLDPVDAYARNSQVRPDAKSGNNDMIVGAATAGAAVIGASLSATVLKNMVKGSGTAISKTNLYGKMAGGALIAGLAAGTSTDLFLADHLQLTNKIKRISTAITLYSPSNIKTDYSFNYDTDKNLLADLLTKDGSEHISEGLKSLGGAASAVPRIVAVASNDTIGLLSKTALNPKKTMMFKEVSPRTFSFEYRFAPRSKEEALEVSNIIKMFKVYAHPEMIEGYANFLYIYPAEFDIEYHYIDEKGNSGLNKHLNKISSCYLEQIEVKYGEGGSFQSLANGEPMITDMALVFREIDRLHRDSVMGGY